MVVIVGVERMDLTPVVIWDRSDMVGHYIYHDVHALAVSCIYEVL